MAESKKGGKRKAPQDLFVSVIAVVTDEAENLVNFVQSVSERLMRGYTNYEIIIVNNGAHEAEIKSIADILDRLPCIRIINLSQQKRYDTAVFAGLEAAIGDFVCVFNPVVDPVEELEVIITQNQQHSVVQGVSKTPIHGVFGSQMGRKLFYWYNRKYMGISIPLNATYFSSYSRGAVNALTTTNRSHRHLRHLVRLIGFKPHLFEYTPKQNPSSQRSLRTGIVEALEIAASYSTHPLRFVTWLGFFAGIIDIIYAVYVLMLNVFKTQLATGWTSLSLQLSGMFFLLFVIMVILAEYVGRILTESRHEPQYYITEELTSSVSLADKSRRNITK